jgi:hypothetical protein
MHSGCMSGHNGTEEDVDGTGLTRTMPPMVRVEEEWVKRRRKPPRVRMEVTQLRSPWKHFFFG